MSHLFLVVLTIASVCFLLVTCIYMSYFLFISKGPKSSEYLHTLEEAMSRTLVGNELPTVSMLIPAYNEEKVIATKLRDLAAMQYPHEKWEVILIDDCSTDGTSTVAERAFAELHLPGRIIRNAERIGVNGCYNRGLQESAGDLIATSDADVMVDHEALLKSLKVFSALRDVGGITSRMVPVSSVQTAAVRIEEPYRDFYDNMCVAESAIHSTFPGYTNFALIRRSAFPSMPVGYGSSDGNISLAVIRRGFRFLYVPSIVFYEPIAADSWEQVRQKTRRAARMIQSAWANRDMLFNKNCGTFGTVVFPLRFLMLIVSPLLLLTGCILALIALAYISIYLSLSAVVLSMLALYTGSRAGFDRLGLLHSLVVHQCYLLIGLFLSGRRRSVWRPVERNTFAGTS